MADTDFSEYLKSVREAPVPQAAIPPAPATVPTVDFSSYLDSVRSSKAPVITAKPPVAEVPTAPARTDYSQLNYSENDLVKDEFFKPIQDYMVDRFGTHMQDVDREELVGMFTNNMRGFAGGNSVRSINEITYLNEVGDDQERLSKAGEAYALFEGMQGLTGDTSTGEKAEVVWDYARSAVVDPINLLGLGLGKVATGTGFKAGSQLAMIAAKQAFKKKLATELGKGVAEVAAKETAQKFAERVFRAQSQKAITQTNIKIAQRQVIEKAATTNLQRMTTSTALKEAAVVGTFESAVAAGTDYLYQDAMLRTKVQDEYNVYQTGLSAVVGLVAGGLSGMLGNVGAGKSKLVAPSPLKTSGKGNTSISKLFTQTTTNAAGQPATPPMKGALRMGDWMKDVARGRELTDQDNEFFLTMILGNDEKGLKGLGQILLEDGYVWVRRSKDDKVSNWIGDIIKQADPQDAKKFLDEFTKATGIDMVDGKKLTVGAFADTFKKKMSDSGRLLNSVSQMAKLLGRDPKTFTLDDYARVVLGGGVEDITTTIGGKASAVGAKLGKTVDNIINRDLPDFQNNVIRLMVSNLSTTALNVTGYAAMTGLNSAADITRAVLYGGKAGLLLAADPAAAKKAGIEARDILRNQLQKARNTLDVNTTYETFLRYAQVRPDAMRQLTAVLPGGVESLEKLAKGFDPSKPLLTMKANQAVDVIQRINLVSAQDGITKAIEFTSQLDKFLRRSREDGGFGMSWNEFFSNPNHTKEMLSDRYVKLEAMAVDNTLKTVFSKSYKGKGAIGEIAGIIEDARNIPGIGLLVPFGRFFNNTVAMMYEGTGVLPMVSKALGKRPTEGWDELTSKALVSWSLIGIMAQREQDYIKMGLGWSEEIDESTGEVVDERYEFPYGAYKAAARLVAHYQTDVEVPAALGAQLTDQFFGQLTRQLGEAGTGLTGLFEALISDEGPGLAKTLGETIGSIPSQALSGITRPLEPLNVAVGLARDEEFYTPDRKQGNKILNESLRYVDQFVAAALGENLAPPKYSAAEGQPTVQASRLVSTTRGSRLTNTERVMNSIGLPGFKANMASLSEPADNRFNQLFNTLIEDNAGALFDSKKFQNGDLETKQMLWTKLLNDTRKSVKGYMGRIAAGNGDGALLKMLDISGFPKLRVQRTMEDLGFDRPIDELSEEELYTLHNALKFREEFLMNKP